MKTVVPFRDPERVRRLADAIAATVTRPHTLMELCGGLTHAILRYRLDALLPEGVQLVHGPGCPVCLTPASHIDRAIHLARREDVVLCSFGDVLRVPGTHTDLQTARAEGADVHVVASPTDALALARDNPCSQVVFFAAGFEPTAPTTAMVAHLAHTGGVANFSLLVSHLLVPAAMHALLRADDHRVDGFLAGGHVCAVAGTEPYVPIAERHRVPIVVSGFEPVELLQAILWCVRQLEEGRAEVENAYPRVVRKAGNPAARAMVDRVFEVTDQQWRGFGRLPASALRLRPELRDLDAVQRFGLEAALEIGRADPHEEVGGEPWGKRPEAPVAGSPDSRNAEPDGHEMADHCRLGEVLRGVLRPSSCPAFGSTCTPERPLGPPMVSAEGACAATYRYRAGAAGLRV